MVNYAEAVNQKKREKGLWSSPSSLAETLWDSCGTKRFLTEAPGYHGRNSSCSAVHVRPSRGSINEAPQCPLEGFHL